MLLCVKENPPYYFDVMNNLNKFSLSNGSLTHGTELIFNSNGNMNRTENNEGLITKKSASELYLF